MAAGCTQPKVATAGQLAFFPAPSRSDALSPDLEVVEQVLGRGGD